MNLRASESHLFSHLGFEFSSLWGVLGLLCVCVLGLEEDTQHLDASFSSGGSSLKQHWEGLMLELKLQFFSHLIRRANSLEKTLMLKKIEDK